MSNKVEQLIERLNFILDAEGGGLSGSPTSWPPGRAPVVPGGIYIQRDMDVESLSDDDLKLVHVILHKFYAAGHKELTKTDVKKLHDAVKVRINHTYFDKLDR